MNRVIPLNRAIRRGERMLTVLGLGSAMVFTFLWAGYSEAELVMTDIERRRAPPAPWRDRWANWVKATSRSWPGYNAQVRRELAQVGGSPGRYALQMGIVGALVAVVLGWDLSWWLAPLGFLAGAGIIRAVLHQQYATWVTRVTAQMSDVVVLLKARLQAGETVPQAVRHVTAQLTPPVQIEWQRLVQQLDAGLPLVDAIALFMDQVPERDVAAVMQQIVVYDRESVPADPFGTLAAHLSRMKLLKRDYLVKRASGMITVYTGVAFLVAVVSVLGPTLYGLWVSTVSGMPL